MYTCGPTVYDFAHIGNFRAFLTYDLLKRWLSYAGYDVDHVCNLTDVDDKIIQRMQRDSITLTSLLKLSWTTWQL
jgi:cysteinyl-tRNA synthetase